MCCNSFSSSHTAANTYVKLKDKHPTDYYKWIGAYSYVQPPS